ncbi:MAG: hypothetical protein ACP5D2_00530, partial [Candidatus Nanoarchaeia archaeon]
GDDDNGDDDNGDDDRAGRRKEKEYDKATYLIPQRDGNGVQMINTSIELNEPLQDGEENWFWFNLFFILCIILLGLLIILLLRE